MSYQGVDPPWFGTDVACVEYGSALCFYQKHDCADAMIGIEECHLDLIAGGELYPCGYFERQWLEEGFQVLVGLSSTFQDAFGKVHSMRVFLQAQQQLSCCRRAVNK